MTYRMNYVAFDTETTGLEPGSRLIEIAAIRFDDTGPLDTFHRFVNPSMPMPADAAGVNRIDPAVLATAAPASTILAEFLAWLPTEPVLIIHNAPYDCGIVSWEAARTGVTLCPMDVIDTLAIARVICETRKNDLLTLVEHYGIQRPGNAHRAMSDADAARQYFGIAWPKVDGKPVAWDAAGHDYSYTNDLPDHLRPLPDLIQRGADFAFTYQDAKGDTTDRTITPYGWALVRGVLMFHGFCHLRQERRTFRADRVQERKEKRS